MNSFRFALAFIITLSSSFSFARRACLVHQLNETNVRTLATSTQEQVDSNEDLQKVRESVQQQYYLAVRSVMLREAKVKDPNPITNCDIHFIKSWNEVGNTLSADQQEKIRSALEEIQKSQSADGKPMSTSNKLRILGISSGAGLIVLVGVSAFAAPVSAPAVALFTGAVYVAGFTFITTNFTVKLYESMENLESLPARQHYTQQIEKDARQISEMLTRKIVGSALNSSVP